MTAKKSSIRTVVSGSERAVCVGAVRGLDADFVDFAGEDVVSEVAEVRRGRDGPLSMDVRDGFWECVGSVG